MSDLRIGRVSKTDPPKGMISVTYPDLDDATTTLIPVISFNDEYKLPQIGEEVIVLHMPNGEALGFVLGRYWNETNTPAVSGENVYRKEIGHSQGDAYIEHKDGDILKIHAKDILLETSSGSILISEVIDKLREIGELKEKISNLEAKLQ